PTTNRSYSWLPRRITSRWPRWTGSKTPVYTATWRNEAADMQIPFLLQEVDQAVQFFHRVVGVGADAQPPRPLVDHDALLPAALFEHARVPPRHNDGHDPRLLLRPAAAVDLQAQGG